MAVGKESIKRAASSTTKKPATRKTTAAKTKAAEVAVEAAAAEENAAKFMQTEPAKENKNQPVRLTDKMPVHLL